MRAMLAFEGALAGASAAAGLIPDEAGRSIAIAAQDVDSFDIAAIIRDGRAVGNPAEPLVRALRAAVDADAADYVHHGSTSQDVVDSAAMVVARDALTLAERDLAAVEDACARLAEAHVETLMVGRTLMQQALPTTFGMKAASWLVNTDRARDNVNRVRRSALAASLGGPAGLPTAFGVEGPNVVQEVSARLGLPEQVVPWHTARSGVARIGAALAVAAGAVDKIALDVILLSQTEVGEVAEPGPGGSSSMAHKKNPTKSILARALTRHAIADGMMLVNTMAHEHERAAGAWHAEWESLSGVLATTAAAARSVAEVLDGLEVRPDRMLANLELLRGVVPDDQLDPDPVPPGVPDLGRAGHSRAPPVAAATASRTGGRSGPRGPARRSTRRSR